MTTNTLDFALERLTKDDRFLRSLSTREGARGEDESDYRHMYDLYVRISERLRALDNDPTAFITPHNTHDKDMYRIMAVLLAESRKTIEALNKMRNSDRLTLAILDAHTQLFSELVAIPLGEKLKNILLTLQSTPGADQAKTQLLTFLHQDLIGLFQNAAIQAMETSRSTYKLN